MDRGAATDPLSPCWLMLKLSFACRRSASSGPYPDLDLPCPVQHHGRGSILSGVVGNGFWENLGSLRPWTDPVRAEMSNVAAGTGNKTSLPWSASESLVDIRPGCAGAEQKRSWRLRCSPIGAACQILTEGCALQMPSFPIFLRSMGLKWNALWNPGALRAQSGWRGRWPYPLLEHGEVGTTAHSMSSPKRNRCCTAGEADSFPPEPFLPGHELGKIYLSIPRTGETSAKPTRWEQVGVLKW